MIINKNKLNIELLKEMREARAIKLEPKELRIKPECLNLEQIIAGKIDIKKLLITAMKNDPELVNLDKLIDIVKEAYSEVLEMRYNEFYGDERLIALNEEKID